MPGRHAQTVHFKRSAQLFNPSWPAGHLFATYSQSLEVRWDTNNISSPFCHLTWIISTPWKQPECIFPRNRRVQVMVCAVLLGWLAFVMHFEEFWVFFGKISLVSSFILSTLLITMHLYLNCLCIGEYFPGKDTVCVYRCACVTSLVFHYFFAWLCTIALLFTRNL
jgi:hypothetical protein